MTPDSPPGADAPITAEYVSGRLAVAAAALPAMLSTPGGIEFAKSHAELIKPFFAAYGGKLPPVRPQTLSDPYKESVIVVFSWLNHISESASFLRRAVALRAVPMPNGKPRTWADLGRSLRTNQRKIKVLHDKGIALIVEGLTVSARL